MKRLILLFLALSGFSFCTMGGEPGLDDVGKKKVDLKVMSYNIHHCNPPSAGAKIDLEAIARVINQEKPDLVALQEVDVNTIRSGKGLNQARELARLTGMNYFFSKAIDHEGGDYGVAVLSKYSIVDSIRFALPVDPVIGGEPRTLAAVVVQPKKGPRFVFASTHLDLKASNRVSQSKQIVAHFASSAIPVILAGDFNAVPESDVIKFLDQNFTRSCLNDCAGTIPVENPKRTIDFVMHRPAQAFTVLSTRVINEQYASDHLPVVVEMRFK